MNSKKPASHKRATLPRAVEFDRSFEKDWERLAHSGRYDLNNFSML